MKREKTKWEKKPQHMKFNVWEENRFPDKTAMRWAYARITVERVSKMIHISGKLSRGKQKEHSDMQISFDK